MSQDLREDTHQGHALAEPPPSARNARSVMGAWVCPQSVGRSHPCFIQKDNREWRIRALEGMETDGGVHFTPEFYPM